MCVIGINYDCVATVIQQCILSSIVPSIVPFQHCKMHVGLKCSILLSHCNRNLDFLTRFLKNYLKLNITKIRLVGAEQTDGRDRANGSFS